MESEKNNMNIKRPILVIGKMYDRENDRRLVVRGIPNY
jgi:hypothetical protein